MGFAVTPRLRTALLLRNARLPVRFVLAIKSECLERLVPRRWERDICDWPFRNICDTTILNGTIRGWRTP